MTPLDRSQQTDGPGDIDPLAAGWETAFFHRTGFYIHEVVDRAVVAAVRAAARPFRNSVTHAVHIAMNRAEPGETK